jgi:hypothetical protein
MKAMMKADTEHYDTSIETQHNNNPNNINYLHAPTT